MKKTLIIAFAAIALSACGEKPQSKSAAKQDAAPQSGTGKAYMASGWKAGDKTSWESQLKARAQGSQNEYNRIN